MDSASRTITSAVVYRPSGKSPLTKDKGPAIRQILEKSGYGSAVNAGSLAEKYAACVTLPEDTNPMAWPCVSTHQLSLLSAKTSFQVPYAPSFDGTSVSTTIYESVAYSEGRGLFANILTTCIPPGLSIPLGYVVDNPAAFDSFVVNQAVQTEVLTGLAFYAATSFMTYTGPIFSLKSEYDNAGGVGATSYNNGSLSGPITWAKNGSRYCSYPARINNTGTFVYPITIAATTSSLYFIVKAKTPDTDTFLTVSIGVTSGSVLSFTVPINAGYVYVPLSTGTANYTGMTFQVSQLDKDVGSGFCDISIIFPTVMNTGTITGIRSGSAPPTININGLNHTYFLWHSQLLQCYDIPYASRLPFEGIVQTAQSIRMTSTAATLYDRGVICSGNFPPRVILSELSYPGFKGFTNLFKTYTGKHIDGGYSYQLPNSTPYYLEALANVFTERPNFGCIAQVILDAPGDTTNMPSHEITTCSHFMGSCIDTSYSVVPCPVGYAWYDVLITVLMTAQNGTENPDHANNAKKILLGIQKLANSKVTQFAINALGMVAPRAAHGADVVRRGTSKLSSEALTWL